MNLEKYKGTSLKDIGRTYKCPHCRDYGFELISTAEAKKIIPGYSEKLIRVYGRADIEVQPVSIDCRYCNAKDTNLFEDRRSTAEIPTAFYDARITDFNYKVYREDVSTIEKLIDAFIREFEAWDKIGKGLYICSHTKGSGKTYLASCICNTIMERYRTRTRFASAQKLLDYSKNSDGSGEVSTDPIGLLKKCKVLVLDDLGAKRNGGDWMNDVLFDIIDSRYQDKLVTIITSNIRPDELNLDERIIDRIKAMCIAVKLPEYCVRGAKADSENAEFLKTLGVV